MQNVGIAITVIILSFDDLSIMFDILSIPLIYGVVTVIEALIGVGVYNLVSRYRAGLGNHEDLKETDQHEIDPMM